MSAEGRGRWTIRPVTSGYTFLVRAVPTQPDTFYFETPTAARILCRVTRAEALNLAAWLTALTDGDDEIARLVKEIRA